MTRSYKRSGARANQKYSEHNLKKAILDVKSGKLSMRKASEKYGVPAMTISDHVNGRHPGKYGGQAALSAEEEAKLKKVLLTCAEWNQPLYRTDIMLVVQGYLNRRGRTERRFKNNCPGNDWIISFLKRHQDLTEKICENIKRARASVTRASMNDYFDKLEETLENVPPENIINFDETNFCDDPGAKKVVVKRGVKHARRLIDSSKSSTSVMMAATAHGHLFPPYTVYKAKYLYDTWVEGGVEGAGYNTSPSGWFDQRCFEEWFKSVIIPYARKCSGQTVAMGDNLSSHFSDEVIDLCAKHDISFVVLPPNATHLCQPLDLAFFRPLKISWRQCLEDWKRKNRGVIPKSEFPRVLKKAFEKIGAEKLANNAKSGFRAAGIHPLNKDAVLKNLPSERDADATSEMEDSWTSSIIEHLKKLHSPEEKGPARKKKRLNVTPGKPVTPDQLLSDILEDEHHEAETVEDADSEVDDPGQEEGGSSNQLDRSCSPSDSMVEEPPVKGDFVIARFTTDEDQRERCYVGEIVDIVDGEEEDEGPKLRVKFLRKKQGRKETYFVFPNIEDIVDVSFDDLIRKVKPKSRRRGMFTFDRINENVE